MRLMTQVLKRGERLRVHLLGGILCLDGFHQDVHFSRELGLGGSRVSFRRTGGPGLGGRLLLLLLVLMLLMLLHALFGLCRGLSHSSVGDVSCRADLRNWLERWRLGRKAHGLRSDGLLTRHEVVLIRAGMMRVDGLAEVVRGGGWRLELHGKGGRRGRIEGQVVTEMRGHDSTLTGEVIGCRFKSLHAGYP